MERSLHASGLARPNAAPDRYGREHERVTVIDIRPRPASLDDRAGLDRIRRCVALLEFRLRFRTIHIEAEDAEQVKAKLEEEAYALIGDDPHQLLGDLSDVAVLLVELYAGALTDVAALSGRGGAVSAWDAMRTLRESVARLEAGTGSRA